MTKRMKCEKTKDLLVDYLTRDLDPGEYQRVESHLKTCKTCRDVLEEMKETLHLLDLAQPPLLGPEFTKQVTTDIEEIEKEPIPTPKESLWKKWSNIFPSYRLKPLPVFASIIIVCIGVFIYFTYFSPKIGIIPKKIEVTFFRPLTLKTGDLTSALSAARAAIHLFKGEIAAEETRASGVRLTVKIPVEKEADFLETLKDLGTLSIEGHYKNKEGQIVILFINTL